jgi:hypothetical protein
VSSKEWLEMLNRWATQPSSARGGRVLFVLVLQSTLACAIAKPHEHGVVTVDVAVEGNQLNVALQAPLDNLLGFERAPRNEAERRAAAALLARLRDPAQAAVLFNADAAAQCLLRAADVQAAVLEAGTPTAAPTEHADLEATYQFSCAQPAQLRSLTLALFEVFPRIQRIAVQLAGPKGQSKATLRRPAKLIKLQR